MSLFTADEISRIREAFSEEGQNVLITFRNKYGPTRLRRLWISFLNELGFEVDCLNWWSSAGKIGLLECETKVMGIYGQWVLSDETKLISAIVVDDEEVWNIREGFDAGNVVASEMRAIRIGETGDKD